MKNQLPSVVLIADRVNDHQNLSLSNLELEFTEQDYFEDITQSLSAIVPKVYTYDQPSDFLNNIRKHKNHIVLSIWSGKNSRNRRALVPSICEAYNIAYVGADTYTSILCQDKYLAKQFCKKIGIRTPRAILFDGQNLKSIELLNLPLVIKPSLEGGSIGISSANLVADYASAGDMCNKLFQIFKQPILVEEFVPGKEVSFVVFGNRTKIKLIEALELQVEGDAKFFDHAIFSYEVKKSMDHSITHNRITAHIPNETIMSMRKLFSLLDKVEVLRIDGKWHQNTFHLLELTPDIHFGSECTFAQGFIANNINYHEMLKLILQNSYEEQKV